MRNLLAIPSFPTIEKTKPKHGSHALFSLAVVEKLERCYPERSCFAAVRRDSARKGTQMVQSVLGLRQSLQRRSRQNVCQQHVGLSRLQPGQRTLRKVTVAPHRLNPLWRGMSVTHGDVQVPLSGKRIQALYDSMSSIYDLLTRYEKGSLNKALEIANPRENLVVLEAGFGTGKTVTELARRVGDTGEVYALDISQKMAKRAHRVLRRLNLSDRVNLIVGDAENTSFCDSVFDLVFSSYVLDLIDTAALPRVLLEFKRLLRPSGWLVLVGLSKGAKWYDNMKLYEWVYRRSPSLLGGCRPVLLAPYLQELGFKDVNREYMRAGHLMPTEIVWANKGE